MKEELLLILDTSSKTLGIACMVGDKLKFSYRDNIHLTHARRALKLIDSLMKIHSLKISDVDGFVVSAGPGSFTGVRIGVSIIQAMAFSLEKKLYRANTLEALAYYFVHSNRYVVPVLDARKGEIYAGIYEFQNSKLLRTKPLFLTTTHELLEILKNEKEKSFILTGNGCNLINENDLPDNVEISTPFYHYPDPYFLGLQAVFANEIVSPTEFEPFYLRKF